jgi:hypothetical protein
MYQEKSGNPVWQGKTAKELRAGLPDFSWPKHPKL